MMNLCRASRWHLVLGIRLAGLGKLDSRQLGISVQLLPFCKDSSALSFSKPISTSWSRSLDDIFNGEPWVLSKMVGRGLRACCLQKDHLSNAVCAGLWRRARLGLLFVGFVCKLEELPRRFVIATGFVSFKCELEKRSILDSVTITLPRPDRP